jgi:MFS family permease
MIFGPLAALFSEIFPARVRYSGASLGYQLGAILGGALAPLVATTLLVRFGTPLAISIYMAAMCLITICSVWLMAEQPAAPRHAL